jgi:hypothetical protein
MLGIVSGFPANMLYNWSYALQLARKEMKAFIIVLLVFFLLLSLSFSLTCKIEIAVFHCDII